ncbi:MAG TPA: DMT family transporter [Agriterribacter sp.]|nr:DMT family transporter [Agriterribacter sp.]
MKKALLSLHTAIFFAGFTGILGRLITLNEGLLVWWRLFISVIAIAIIFLYTGYFRKINNRLLWRLLGVGAVVGLHWVFFYASIKYANVSVALVCFSAIGFFSAFFEPLIFRRRIDWLEVLYGALAILGIWLIFQFDKQYKTGVILGIISSLLAALFPVFNKKLLVQISPKDLTFYELTGGLILLTLCLPVYLYFFPVTSIIPSLSDFLWLTVLSLVCTVMAFNLSLHGLKKISAFTVNLSYNLEPVYGILLAFLIYKENRYLNSSFYYGMLLITLAVVLQTLRLYYIRK